MSELTWKLDGVPAYPDGELFDELFLLGGGLNSGFDIAPEDESHMQLVNGTTESAFRAYCETLLQSGFRAGFARDAEQGLFREFLGETQNLYVYFMRRTGQARIIVDRESLSFVDFSAAEPLEDVRDDTELMQFGLFYGDPIRGRVSTCGMLYVIRMHDNRIFLVDGGECCESTTTAFDELLIRLRELTQTAEGEPIRIACWFCTHAHNDHMDLFINLMKTYGDVLKVERILFNFPHPAYTGVPAEHADRFNAYLSAAVAAMKQYCPDVKFMQAHTGQLFEFDNVTAEVILTHEDLFYENEAHEHLGGMNTSSTILRLTFDGSSLLILGDADENNGEVLRRYYVPDEISCTYLQAAHHLANKNENIYSYVRAESVLIPQGRLRIHRIRREHYAILCKYYDRDRFYLEGDYTIVFRVKDGAEEITYYPLQGRPFEPERDNVNLWRQRPEIL